MIVETKKEQPIDMGQAFKELTHKLHHARSHPDFEYASTMKIKASGYSSELVGDGWEANTDYQDGFRDDGQKEIRHWRRLLSIAVREDVHIYDAPEHRIEKSSLLCYVDMLSDRINTGYMPRSKGKVEFNTKPHYVSGNAIRHLIEGSGYYMLEDDPMKPPESDPAEGVRNVVIRPKQMYFGLHIPKGIIHSVRETPSFGLRRTVTEGAKVDLQILTNLRHPGEETYLRACRLDGSWMPWETWRSCTPIGLNRYEVEKLLDVYC